MSTLGDWRGRPLFVSSTFRDFQAERDHLQRVVFPELAERLRARREHLEPIDLRWGVDTFSIRDDAERELTVLKVCLEGIRRSKPFLLVLLGDRYGWVPSPLPGVAPDEQPPARAAREIGYRGPIVGKSVTALEIEYGTLESDEGGTIAAHVFVRRLDHAGADDETRMEFDDAFRAERLRRELEAAHDSVARAELAAALDRVDQDVAALAELKGRLKSQFPGRYHEYTACLFEAPGGRWSLRSDDMIRFGECVLEAIWGDLDIWTADRKVAPQRVWQDEERDALDAWAQDLTRHYSGRAALRAEFRSRAFAAGTDEWGVCVTGEPGSGKSALACALYQELRQHARGTGAIVLFHAAGVTPRGGYVDNVLHRWCGELAARLGLPDPFRAPDQRPTSGDLERAFASLLQRAAQVCRVIVLLDALDQFDASPRCRYLTWLPDPWPRNAILIATSLPGSWTDVFASRRVGCVVRELEGLTQSDASEIASEVCSRQFHRTLNRDVLGAILERQREDSRPAYENPLWLLTAVGELNLIDEVAFSATKTLRDDRGVPLSPGAALHRLLVGLATSFPADVPAMYQLVLGRAEATAGDRLAKAVTCLIALSRRGLRESDLNRLVPLVTGESMSPLQFAILRRALGAHVVQRSENLLWDFTHSQLRFAVRVRYLRDRSEETRLHALIADHFSTVGAGDALAVSETMHHLIGADPTRTALYYFHSALNEPRRLAATTPLADYARTGAEAVEWIAALTTRPELEFRVRVGVAYLFVKLLDPLLTDAIAERKAVLEAARPVLDEALSDPASEADLSARLEAKLLCVAGLGEVAFATGDVRAARAAFNEVLQIGRMLAQERSDDVSMQLCPAVAFQRLGDISRWEGDSDQAWQHLTEGEQFMQRLRERFSGHPQVAALSAVFPDRLGDLAAERGDAEGAMRSYETALQFSAEAARGRTLDPEAIRSYGIMLYKLARAGLTAEPTVSLHRATEAMEILQRLLRDDPADPIYLRDVSCVWEVSGDVEIVLGCLGDAVRSYGECVRVRQEIARRVPGDMRGQQDQIAIQIKLGDLLLKLGRKEEAQAAFLGAFGVWERHRWNLPRDSAAYRDWMFMAARLRALADELGRIEDARTYTRLEIRFAEEGVLAHPADPFVLRNAWSTHHKMFERLGREGDMELSRYHLDQTHWILRQFRMHGWPLDDGEARLLAALDREFGDPVSYGRRKGQDLFIDGQHAHHEQRTAEAVQLYQQCIDLFLAHFQENPDEAENATDLVDAAFRAAICSRGAGDNAHASKMFSVCLSVLRVMRDRDVPMNESHRELIGVLEEMAAQQKR